jgi:CDP-paratose 2-epimerase
LYGASKAAADLMVQEYGKYYNLRTIILRGNCMTGSKHSGTLQHGFLSYLVKCIKDDKPYTVFGYHGKQVRDNIHAVDFVCAIYHCFKEPRMGEVYNLGGGRCSNISIIEAIEKVEFLTQKKSSIIFRDSERKGDHKWYISNTEKFRKHYPKWELTYTISDIILDLLKSSSNASEQITT